MAIHHDEHETRGHLPSLDTVVTPSEPEDAGVARLMSPLLSMLFGGGAPIRFVFWDGSALGPEGGPGSVVLNSVRALTRLIWSPDELGMARSFISGEMDLDGEIYDLLKMMHVAASGKRRLGPREIMSGLW